MGRSGGGGGGHSGGGFGGSHSSGGFSGGGRSSRGFHSSSSSNHYHSSHNTYIYGGRGPYYRGPRRSGGSPFVSILVLIILVIIVMSAFRGVSQDHNGDIPKNTKQREPLSGVVTKTDWYQDEIGWISSSKVMIEGLEDFYHETGIQPYVAMIPYQDTLWNGNDLNVSAANEYLEKLYDEEFKDEGHFIFAYFSCRNDSIQEMDGQFRYMAGYAADTIMDNEAISILWGYFNQYYYDTSYTPEQMIAKTFSKTGEAIMSAPTNGWDFAKAAIFVIGGVAVFFIVYKVIKTKAQRAKEKEQFTKDILEKPLETFGEDTSDLEEKYK